MSNDTVETSEYRSVWVFAFFDLPVTTKKERRAYVAFRKQLLREGFIMLQWSVYARFCSSEEAAEPHRRRLRSMVPPGGRVRLLSVTDRQYGKMEVYHGRKAKEPEEPPDQVLLF
ncbi:MAG: CRISPR-associated endonuclease Cas2 [Candidatus Brocadiia bacterium]